ncbi:hypothetical protein KM043_018093 [Ampulex compressa]|nr:hypothetical protein KM043_018093 [Ampulex compressa]
MKYLILLTIVVVGLCANAAVTEVSQSTNSYLTVGDKLHWKKILEPGLKLIDVPSTYYAVHGFKFLNEALSSVQIQGICNYLTKAAGDVTNITPETAFYIASSLKTVDACKSFPTPTFTKVLTSIVERDDATLAEIYYAVSGLTALSQKLSDERVAKLVKTIQSVLAKDDNLWNLGYTFHIASDLGPSGAFAFDRIEDAVIQADEVDAQYLQFEGGLSITSFLVNGIYKLSSSLKKKPPLTIHQTVKLANYILSRRSVQTAKGVTNLLAALTTLATNEFERPICITLADGAISISEQQPLLKVKVCDLLGNPLSNVPKVIATSATKVGDDVAVLNKETLQPSTADKTLFTLNPTNIKPDRGFYKVSVMAGSVTNTLTVKVLCKVTVDYLEIGTGDADQTTQSKLTRVAFSEKLGHKIEADSQQKLVMRFLLKDASNNKPMRAHQVFVRLSSVFESSSTKQGHEIIFVAEPDTSNVYKFDMPVGSAAASFGHQSGNYNVELIVGDAVLSNSFEWTVATVNLKFPEATGVENADKNKTYKQKPNIYTTKPEIKHMFREPEKRPPAFVSNLFTGLCVAPVLLLLILWARLGVNISNFPLSISAIAFHLGLGSIFVLFGIFWLKLNMFVTLRYLLGLGIITFLAGNKMLSHIAHRHKVVR